MSRIKKVPKLPVNAKTFAFKVLEQDWWYSGRSLYLLIESIYPTIRDTMAVSDNYNDFLHKFSRIPKFEEWCKHHHLSSYHVASSLMERKV